MLVLVGALALGATPALAVHSSGGAVQGALQIEGDVCGGGSLGSPAPAGCVDPAGADDWDNLYSCSGTLGVCSPATPGTCAAGVGCNSATDIAALVFDPSPISIFTGGGSMDSRTSRQRQHRAHCNRC